MTQQYKLASSGPVDLDADITINKAVVKRTAPGFEVHFDPLDENGFPIVVTFPFAVNASKFAELLPEGTQLAVTLPDA